MIFAVSVKFKNIKIKQLQYYDDRRIQKLAVSRHAAAPWQASPAGVPFKKGQHLPPLLSSCRPARLHYAPIIPRRHASINTHLPCNTVHGEALLLLQIWHVHSIQISHLMVSVPCAAVTYHSLFLALSRRGSTTTCAISFTTLIMQGF